MKAAITGVCGFVGQHLAQHLMQQGDQVLGTARRVDLTDAVQIPSVEWDISLPLNSDAEKQLFEFAPDVIYHLAGMSVPADCGLESPSAMATEVNVTGTQRVMELAARLPARPKVLFTSTCHVYEMRGRENPVVTETAPLGPAKPYGQTKLAAEHIVQSLAAEHDIPAVIVRAFQHTGPGQAARMMVPEWASQLAEFATHPSSDSKEPLKIRTRNAWLDLSDVRDVVRAYRLLVFHGTGIYNVGSGHAICSGEVAERLLEIAGKHRPIVETLPTLKQEPIANIQRLQQDTGWQPQIPLDETLADTFAYWQEQFIGDAR